MRDDEELEDMRSEERAMRNWRNRYRCSGEEYCGADDCPRCHPGCDSDEDDDDDGQEGVKVGRMICPLAATCKQTGCLHKGEHAWDMDCRNACWLGGDLEDAVSCVCVEVRGE